MNSSKILLHQFAPNWGFNASPFCMKLETYLRMMELPYETVSEETLKKTSKGKMPYIIDGDRKIGDSNLIIEYLKTQYGDRTDGHLSASDRAISLAMRRLIDENLYWCVVYSRWMDDRNWPITRDAYFGSLPPVVKQILPGVLRKETAKNLHGHGMGRHDATEIYEIGCRDLQALSDFLGDKEFFFGVGDAALSLSKGASPWENRPTILDAAAHAVIAGFLKVPMNCPMTQKTKELANLVAFSDRMTTKYYPA